MRLSHTRETIHCNVGLQPWDARWPEDESATDRCPSQLSGFLAGAKGAEFDALAEKLGWLVVSEPIHAEDYDMPLHFCPAHRDAAQAWINTPTENEPPW